MSTARASRSLLALPLVGAATTWVAMWSWRPFTELPGRYLAPLLLIGLVVAATGVVARSIGLRGVVVFPLQVVAGSAVASVGLTGNALPLGREWAELRLLLAQAVDSANTYAAPVPSDVPGIHPLLILGGLACFLLVDLLLATLRRLSLAGLPLLTIYSVPVSVVGGEVSGWVFAATAAGFLTMLYLHESEQVDRWGRTLPQQRPADQRRSRGPADVRPGRARATATVTGLSATALALALPPVAPTVGLHLVDFGRGAGSDQEITLSNPMTDLKRDLVLGDDVPVLRLRTDDPDPSYLRMTALTLYEGETWSAGDRQVPLGNRADGELPPLAGVDPSVRRREHDFEVDVLDTFESTWLPTMPTSTSVVAEGDWRYDEQTRDFLAADDDLDTAGLSYTMSAVELQHDATTLARASSLAELVPPELTALPEDLPEEVRDLALQVTREAPTRFEKAVALQRWFRETGGFTYSTAREEGNDTGDLVAFLRSDGRVGYCEQFSAAMAVMARALGIPARVAVGFLNPDPVGADTWEYSTRDLHAWPELFFPGSGWVRFEPTPAQRAETAPRWTLGDVVAPDPADRPGAGAEPGVRTPDRAPEVPGPESVPAAAAEPAAEDGSAAPLVAGSLVVVLLVGLALLPRTIRRRRRDRRHDGGPEDAWDELRDTALDLGLAWPLHRSPRQTRDWVAAELAAVPGSSVASRAFDRVVASVERSRYSGRPVEARPLSAEVDTVTEALRSAASPRGRRTADWWPRSVVSSTARSRAPQAPERTVVAVGSAVDRVSG